MQAKTRIRPRKIPIESTGRFFILSACFLSTSLSLFESGVALRGKRGSDSTSNFGASTSFESPSLRLSESNVTVELCWFCCDISSSTSAIQHGAKTYGGKADKLTCLFRSLNETELDLPVRHGLAVSEESSSSLVRQTLLCNTVCSSHISSHKLIAKDQTTTYRFHNDLRIIVIQMNSGIC